MSGRLRTAALAGAMILLWISITATHSKPSKKIEQGYAPGAGGVRLFYRKIGTERDVVMFLHGGPGASMHDGGHEMEPIAEDHTLIMYDQRGGGRSDIITDASRLTAADHVRDLEALRRHFRIEKFSLIGLSWGSGLAALYASEYPDRVSRIVFLAPLPPARSPYLQQRVDKTNSLLSAQDIGRYREIIKLYPASTDEEAVSLCREQFRIIDKPYRLKPRSAESESPDICNVPPAAIRNFWVVNAAVFKSLGDYDFRPKLTMLRMPVLVIEGARSAVPLDATEEWARSAPNARLLLIPDAGHGVYHDEPKALLNAIRRFLRGDWPATATEMSQRNGTGGK